MSVSLVVGSKAVTVQPGEPTTIETTVRNTGTVVDEFRLEVLGDGRRWTTVEPASVRLFPNTTETVTVRFAPPRDSSVPAGPMPFGVKAVSAEDPSSSAVDEGTVDVAAFVELFAEFVPRTVRGRRRGKAELAIDNRGNAQANLEVRPVSNDDVDVDLEVPSLRAEAGTATFTNVAVKPLTSFWRGPARTLAFSAVVHDETVPPVTVDGTMLQDPILPRWFWKAVLAALLLLLALILLWFLLLKPTVESAAKEAVGKELEEAKQALDQAAASGPTAAEAAKKAEESAAKAEDAAASAGGSAASTKPDGTPIDFRLQVVTTTTGSQTKTFEGLTFNMTDVVFQNPESDSGRITLLRGSEVILEVNLDNFRDLDYHYVTPVVFTDTLVVEVTCENTTGVPPPEPGAACRPAVSLSGTLTSP